MSNFYNLDDYILFTPFSTAGNTKNTAISVDHYDEVRDINQAILASLGVTGGNNLHSDNFVDLVEDTDEDHYNIVDPHDDLFIKSESTPIDRKLKGPLQSEKGETSKSQTNAVFICEICVEPKSFTVSFSIKGCTHAYCKDCITKYVASKLRENRSNIRCPVSGCAGLLEPAHCRAILPKEVFDRWGNALCEAAIIGSEKFYCPYKDCSAMMIDDGDKDIKESECPNCNRLFCAQCKVPWHSEISCKEFQKLHKGERDREDIMLMNLAANKHWRRCPSCRFYVERTVGCGNMKCRCGCSFCYYCGCRNVSHAHSCNKRY